MSPLGIDQRNFGVTIGVVAGIIANAVVLQIGMMVYPIPELDPNDAAAMSELISTMHLGQLGFTYGAPISQAGVGALVGCLSNRKTASRTGLLVGGITAMFCMLNLMMIPHPEWFWSEVPVVFGLGWGIGSWMQEG